MKPVSNITNELFNTTNIQKIEAIAEKSKQKAYLKSRGIEPNSNYQLDLIFSETIGNRSDLRHIPNDFARSSLFTTRNKNQPRKAFVLKKLFSYNECVSISYTGVELRADDDELVWLQAIDFCKNTPMGRPVTFSIKELSEELSWTKNGRNYDRIRECIARLRSNSVLIENTTAYGKGIACSLITDLKTKNDDLGKTTEFQVSIDKAMVALFAGNTFTSHKWLTYRKLSPIARRLADYTESHKHPYPLDIDRFRQMCGSDCKKINDWRKLVIKACIELEQAKILKRAILGTFSENKDKIIFDCHSRL